MRGETNLRKKIEDYSYGLVDILADNTSSKVYKGIRENTKETVAIKVIDIKGFKNKQNKKALEMEIDVLRKVHHSNILKCLDVYSTFNNCYIITEYCEGGDLKSVLEQRKTKYTNAEAISIFKDVYKGYKYLFLSGYLHRNIDPSNILIKNGEYKLSDFGTASKELDLPIKIDETITASPYRSPEALKTGALGPKCDVWALGVLLYELLENRLPFQNYDDKFSHKSVPHFSSDVPKNAKQFIEKCFLTTSLRVTFSQLQSDPFIIQVLATPSVPTVMKQDYNSLPMTKVVSKLQNKPTSEIDRIKDQRKNKGEIVAKSQIGFMRFIFRLQEILPESKLHYLVLKHLLTILQCFKKSTNSQNPFQCEYLRDFFSSERSRKVVQVVQSYAKKYSHLPEQFQKYIIKGTKDRHFLSLLDNNLQNREGLILSIIPYTIEEIKSTISELKSHKLFEKLEESEVLPKQLQSLALKADYLVTYYQLNCIRISDWSDYLLFVDQSRIDQILEYPPGQMQKIHVKSLEKKIKDLQI